MTTYTIDTAAAIRKIKEAQCDETLAEAIVGVIAKRDAELATKAGILVVKSDLRELKAQLTTRMLMIQGGSVAILYGLIRLFGVG